MKNFGRVFLLISSVFLISTGILSCSQNASPAGQQLSIQSLSPVQNQVLPGGTVVIQSSVINPSNATLSYKWSASGGGFGGSGQNNIWQAPSQIGVYDITLVVEDGKGGYAQSKTSITVSSNRAPAISSLSANPVNVTPGGSTVITCVASDPDGDIVRFSWSAGDGSISGTGNRVTWISPNKNGDISITCTVSDGKGAESKQTILVNVTPSTSEITLKLVRQESGTVSSTGDRDTTRYRAGDDAANLTYRAFFSFDIFGLNKTNVRQAKIKFGPGTVVGDPFNALGGLRLWRVNYGEGLPDYNITGETIFAASAVLTTSPNEIDVTNEVRSLIAAGATRLQVEALFYRASNGNDAIDYVEWPEASLLITFAP
ncbi:MAG: PKD domain-containing protein [Dehalococcoidia bacterium]